MFRVHNRRFGRRWTLELTTVDSPAGPGSAEYAPRGEIYLTARSITVLRRVA